MRDIEKKAMALLNASEKEMGLYKTKKPQYEIPSYVALYLAIEQHEATKQEFSDFRQEVSDAVENLLGEYPSNTLRRHLHQFIIPAPKPDPLVSVVNEVIYAQPHGAIDEVRMANNFRAALDAAGFEIREKSK